MKRMKKIKEEGEADSLPTTVFPLRNRHKRFLKITSNNTDPGGA
jgi:hypothetical protein